MSKISYLFKTTKLPNGGELCEYSNSRKSWWLNGKRHREDGPAIEHSNGYKVWYINDVRIPCKTQEEFERLMKLKAFW
jgi:hypothetical protein